MRIYRRQGSPYYWFDFSLTIDGTSHRFRGSTQSASKADAELIAANLRRERLLEGQFGKKPQHRSWTLEEACTNYWIEHARFKPSADDLAREMKTLQRLIGSGTVLENIDNSVIASHFIARRRGEAATNRNNARVSNRTVNSEVETLRAIIRRSRKVHKVATTEIDWQELLLEVADARDRYLSVDECRRLLAAAADHLRPIIRTTLWTGLRKSNVLGLDWRQIDLHAREMTVAVKSTKPGGKKHVLPIVAPLAEMLNELGPRQEGPVFQYLDPHPCQGAIDEAAAALERHGGNYSAAARELGLSDNGLRKRLLSARRSVRPRPIRSIETAWRAALRRAGIADFRFHDLRHTCGSWLVQNGVGIEVVQKILGHAEISTTLRYLHHQTDAKRAALDTLTAQMRHTDLHAPDQAIEKKIQTS